MLDKTSVLNTARKPLSHCQLATLISCLISLLAAKLDNSPLLTAEKRLSLKDGEQLPQNMCWTFVGNYGREWV
jgi:hypothetical protein